MVRFNKSESILINIDWKKEMKKKKNFSINTATILHRNATILQVDVAIIHSNSVQPFLMFILFSSVYVIKDKYNTYKTMSIVNKLIKKVMKFMFQLKNRKRKREKKKEQSTH